MVMNHRCTNHEGYVWYVDVGVAFCKRGLGLGGFGYPEDAMSSSLDSVRFDVNQDKKKKIVNLKKKVSNQHQDFKGGNGDIQRAKVETYILYCYTRYLGVSQSRSFPPH